MSRFEKIIRRYCEITGFHHEVETLVKDCMALDTEQKRELEAHFVEFGRLMQYALSGTKPESYGGTA